MADGTILVSTVDAFQGGERDIIIISSARTSSVGFTDNAERLNVALTRARHHLIIVGNAITLQASKTWAAVIQYKDMCRGTIDCLHEHLRNNRRASAQSDGSEDQNLSQEDVADMEAWAAEVAAHDSQVEAAPKIDPNAQPLTNEDEAHVGMQADVKQTRGEVVSQPPDRPAKPDDRENQVEGACSSLWS